MGKYKEYNNITGYTQICRRYFVNNFYDGMLTILGILLGFFVILLNNPNQPIQSNYIILTGVGTSISMFISGVSGSYLSEKAEQRKEKKELDIAMGIVSTDQQTFEVDVDEKEIEKAMVIPPKNFNDNIKKRRALRRKKKKQKKHKTIHDKAERFTGVVVALVNGLSPFLGGIVAIFPFFFVKEARFTCFITSFTIIFVCIVLLGIFLGKISKESILKNVMQMLGAFTLTIIIIILILGI